MGRADVGGTEQLVEELRRSGGHLVHVSADLADPETPGRLVAAARDAFGRLDVVVANHARSVRQSLAELTTEALDLTYAVNTRATLLLVKDFAPGSPSATPAAEPARRWTPPAWSAGWSATRPPG